MPTELLILLNLCFHSHRGLTWTKSSFCLVLCVYDIFRIAYGGLSSNEILSGGRCVIALFYTSVFFLFYSKQ